jgi:hypothetical protein
MVLCCVFVSLNFEVMRNGCCFFRQLPFGMSSGIFLLDVPGGESRRSAVHTLGIFQYMPPTHNPGGVVAA